MNKRTKRTRWSHRAIWAATCAVVTLTVLVFVVRDAGERTHSAHTTPTEPPAGTQALIERMFELLEDVRFISDDPQTARVVADVAALAESGEYESAETYYALGLVRAEAQDFKGAEKAYRKAIAIRPEWNKPYHGLGFLLTRHTVERWDEAEAMLRKAIELEPDWSRPHNHLAILLRRQNRFEEAEIHALRAIEANPDIVATHNNYGNLLLKIRRLNEAEKQYRRAIDLDPAHPKPYYNLGCLYSVRGKPRQAVEYLAEAIERDPVFREEAKNDPDFDPIRNTTAFRKLIYDKD